MYDMAESEIPGAEYDQNGNLVAKYHHEGGGLMAMTRNNSSYWYGFEGIGTVRQLMDGQGQVFDAYTFDAWGNELTSPQSQVPNPFRYVGKHGYYLDTQSGLILLGIRYYNHHVGQFMSLDPIGEGLNWYVYAYINPINAVDPEGTKTIGVNPTDEYCKAANGPKDGMWKANKCFCKVSGMIDELIGGRLTLRGLLASAFCYTWACNDWLKCMKNCIYQDWSRWWNEQRKKHKINIGLQQTINRPKPIIPPGNPKPDDCWQSKLLIEIDGKKKTIDQWCENPTSKECCYAVVTCEKHSLFRCLSKCRKYQVVPIGLPSMGHGCCFGVNIYYIDCLRLLDDLTEYAGAEYPYTGSLKEQIKASRRICCDTDWPYQ